MSPFSIVVNGVRESVAMEIDEAQQDAADLAADLCYQHYQGGDWTGRKAVLDALLDQAFALPEEGGTVGPLPDGSTISVEPIDFAVELAG